MDIGRRAVPIINGLRADLTTAREEVQTKDQELHQLRDENAQIWTLKEAALAERHAVLQERKFLRSLLRGALSCFQATDHMLEQMAVDIEQALDEAAVQSDNAVADHIEQAEQVPVDEAVVQSGDVVADHVAA